MDLGEFIPITAIIATAWVAVVVLRIWQRAHFAETDAAGAAGGSGAGIAGAEENARLAHENEKLRLTITRLEDRMAVLERIATDPAERTAREIEELR